MKEKLWNIFCPLAKIGAKTSNKIVALLAFIVLETTTLYD
jgi:hypothetical protein